VKKQPLCNARVSVPRGFTLIELLVVISIVSLLIAILLPALAKARASGWMVQCGANQRQLFLASAMYSEDETLFHPMYTGNKNWHRHIYRYVSNGGNYNGWGDKLNDLVARGGTWAYADPADQDSNVFVGFAMNDNLIDQRTEGRSGVIFLLDFFETTVTDGSRSSVNFRLRGRHHGNQHNVGIPPASSADPNIRIGRAGFDNVTFEDGHIEQRKPDLDNMPERLDDRELWDYNP